MNHYDVLLLLSETRITARASPPPPRAIVYLPAPVSSRRASARDLFPSQRIRTSCLSMITARDPSMRTSSSSAKDDGTRNNRENSMIHGNRDFVILINPP